MDYKVCSMLLTGRIKKRINLDTFYQTLLEEYNVEYNPEVSNRIIVHLCEASVLFFTSGTIQIYLKDPTKKEETIGEANRMIGLMNPDITASF